jgi:hypothetical protein
MNPGSAPPYCDPYDAVIDGDRYPVWKRLYSSARGTVLEAMDTTPASPEDVGAGTDPHLMHGVRHE